MAMKQCPICGEKYSETYKNCPFCEEEAAFQEGGDIRRGVRGGKRAARSRQFSLITPTLIVLIVVMAALLIYLLYGSKLMDRFGGGDQSEQGQQTQDVTPQGEDDQSAIPGGEDEDGESSDDEADTPEAPDQTQDPEDGDAPDQPDTSTNQPADKPAETGAYEKIAALPAGLTLSTTDFTLRSVGESATITVSGSGTFTWASEDESVATVDQNGKVTAVSKGTVNVVVSDGTKKGVCIVRCNVPAGQSGSTGSGGSSGSSSNTGSGMKAGAAVVVNGGNGVFVRSGPGTDHEALATIPNGASVRIVESAGGGWYKITFSGSGGADTTGYMKGDFLSNK